MIWFARTCWMAAVALIGLAVFCAIDGGGPINTATFCLCAATFAINGFVVKGMGKRP